MQDRQVPLDVFVGRAAELAWVAEVLTRVEAGQPWLVAIEGDPGMGKTTLVRRCLAQASGLKVLSARGDQAEAYLDFGIVDQLLRAAGDAVPTVPSTGGASPSASSFAVGAHLLQVVGGVERLRRANELCLVLRAAPFVAQTEEELAACHLPADPAKKQQPVLELTSRETEVAHLVGKGLSNPEIAAELFISRKAVEYHLGNIYAKFGLHGRQQLRRFVEQWRQPATI